MNDEINETAVIERPVDDETTTLAVAEPTPAPVLSTETVQGLINDALRRVGTDSDDLRQQLLQRLEARAAASAPTDDQIIRSLCGDRGFIDQMHTRFLSHLLDQERTIMASAVEAALEPLGNNLASFVESHIESYIDNAINRTASPVIPRAVDAVRGHVESLRNDLGATGNAAELLDLAMGETINARITSVMASVEPEIANLASQLQRFSDLQAETSAFCHQLPFTLESRGESGTLIKLDMPIPVYNYGNNRCIDLLLENSLIQTGTISYCHNLLSMNHLAYLMDTSARPNNNYSAHFNVDVDGGTAADRLARVADVFLALPIGTIPRGPWTTQAIARQIRLGSRLGLHLLSMGYRAQRNRTLGVVKVKGPSVAPPEWKALQTNPGLQ